MILRLFIFLILINSSIFADAIKSVLVAPQSDPTNFQKVSLPFKRQTTQNYLIQLQLDPSFLEGKTPYVLKIETEFGRYNISADPNYPKDILEPNIFHLDRAKSATFIFTINNITNSIRFDAEVYKAKEYFQNKKTKEILYGISYGIMISAILYYLAFFIFNRYKSYIYYSLTQFFMLFILILVTHRSFNDQDEMLFAIFYSGFIIFTALFSSSFLQLHRYAPLWNKILFISSAILIIDAFTNVFTLLHIPIVELMFIYILVAIIVYFKTSQKYILFYLGGWGMLISSFVFLELETIFFTEFIIEPNDLLHIAMPLESLILAFALSYKMRLIENEKVTKERMLIEYDKRASIGDMLDNIAHQWRQPLTYIGYSVMNVSGAIRNNRFDQNYWTKKEDEINLQLEYMSQTITDFRDFYKPSTKKSKFSLFTAIEKTHNMLKSVLKLHEISFEIHGNRDILVFGNESELRQVILNLLHNAQEAFEEKKIQTKTITITLQNNSIYVKDNAGGIPANIQKELFNVYSSTKKSGSGRGLYMSKLIIEEHFQGTLHHQNTYDGSLFMIDLDKSIIHI